MTGAKNAAVPGKRIKTPYGIGDGCAVLIDTDHKDIGWLVRIMPEDLTDLGREHWKGGPCIYFALEYEKLNGGLNGG
jgi:hypothetical protein